MRVEVEKQYVARDEAPPLFSSQVDLPSHCRPGDAVHCPSYVAQPNLERS